VYGEPNDLVVQGAFVVRGQDATPAFEVAPDYDSYEFTKLDPAKAEDRAFVEDQWAGDKAVKVNGKEYKVAEGKCFK
jgi:elongation factor 1-gamma